MTNDCGCKLDEFDGFDATVVGGVALTIVFVIGWLLYWFTDWIRCITVVLVVVVIFGWFELASWYVCNFTDEFNWLFVLLLLFVSVKAFDDSLTGSVVSCLAAAVFVELEMAVVPGVFAESIEDNERFEFISLNFKYLKFK